jgi:hypothetical protein
MSPVEIVLKGVLMPMAAGLVPISIPMPGPRIPAWIKGSLLVALAGTFAVPMRKPPGFDETWDRIIVFLAVAGPAAGAAFETATVLPRRRAA